MTHPQNTSGLSRRSILAAIPATAVLAACVPSAGGLGEDRFESSADGEGAIDHSTWDALLQEYVVAGDDGVNRVEYARMKEEAADQLASYLSAMQAVAIEDYGTDEQFAFWVNLYNAATVDVIVQNLPLKSIRDIGILGTGPWKRDAVTVSGRTLSLDNIEHDILRPEWQDVRIHYAVNCASIGCPNLATKAFTGSNLEEMLEAAAKSYINHPRGFGGEPGKIIASNIYNWYEVDWGSEQAVLDHAREYAEGPTVALLEGAERISKYDYDWSLNAA
ncbi:MAG: DUF547 domain-containing protein [Pseudomonadota bacterium]|nr:DUF547 domain-containing protein [Pseudomonadota bacterium]